MPEPVWSGLVTSGTLIASSYGTVEDEGTPLAQRTTINFVGAGVTAADAGGKTVVTVPGFSLTANTAVVYVSKVGNDASDGLTVNSAKLTIGSAITAASALITGGATGVRISVEDGGTYTEAITVPANVTLDAAGAVLVGTISLASDSTVHLNKHYASNNNDILVLKTGGTGQGHYFCNWMDTRGTGGTYTGCTGIRNVSSGSVVFARIGVLFVCASGKGISDSGAGFGHIHFWAADLYLAGNSAVGISAESASTNIIGYIDHILETGSPTSTVGISVTNAGAIVKATITEIIADEAYNISAGSLHLVCAKLTGSRTGTPVFEMSPSTLSGVNTGDQTFSLDDLSDVVITTPATGHVLRHNGTNFVNVAASSYYVELTGNQTVAGTKTFDFGGVKLKATSGTNTASLGMTAGSGNNLVAYFPAINGSGFMVVTNAANTFTAVQEVDAIGGVILSTNAVGNGDSITIKPPDIGVAYTLTLPVDDGTSGQYLKTDGSGVLSWGTLYNQTVEDEGTPVTQRSTLNFTGAGVSVTDDAGKTKISIPGGAGEAFPVGAIYINVTGVNPGTELGYGTWSAFGAGRVLVGYDSGDTDFDTVLETGGAKTVAAAGSVAAPTISGSTASEAAHTHTYTEVPNHTHPVNITDPGHTHLTQRYPTATGASSGFTADTSMSGTLADNTLPTKSNTTGITATTSNNSGGVATGTTSAGSSHSHGVGTLAASAPAFTGSATSVVQPYIVVHFWRRTA